MQINILLFGQLVDLLGDNFILMQVKDTDALTTILHDSYPVLVNTKYVMAVDKKMVTTNTPLFNNSTVALMPAFSGG